jgi:hypothetical protein
MELAPLAPTRVRQQTLPSPATIWSREEDELLKHLIGDSVGVSWSALAVYFPRKTAPQLASRWDKVLNPRLVKGSWTHEEDETIIKYVEEYGDKSWARLAAIIKDRTGKQCRERYKNHLDTSVNRSEWTPEEDQKLAQLQEMHGNSWTKIAAFFEGRTDNCIKNRWNSVIKKRADRLKRGEPAVAKRGRKPKTSFGIPVITSVVQREDSSCSSPLDSMAEKPKAPTIKFLPLSDAVRAKMASIEPAPIPSLVQNRIDFARLLAGQ